MEKQMKKYLSQVKRRLNLPREIRDRLLSDLQTTIAARMEQGEDWKTIRESLGTPAQVASEYTEQMKEYAYRKSPWRFLFLIPAVAYGLRTAFLILRKLYWTFLPSNDVSVGIIGGADGPTAIFLTTRLLGMWFWPTVNLMLHLLCFLIYLRLRKCKNKENSQG